MLFTDHWIGIRFIPDSNRDKTQFKAKLERLREEIEYQIERITIPSYLRSKSYFNSVNTTLVLTIIFHSFLYLMRS